MRTTLSRAVLFLYTALILYLTLVLFAAGSAPVNWVPFRTIRHDWQVGGRDFLVNFVCNIGAFLPIGFLLPLVRRKPLSGMQVTLACLLLSAAIEAAQGTLGHRVADVDDVLLNTIGGAFGYLALRALSVRSQLTGPGREFALPPIDRTIRMDLADR